MPTPSTGPIGFNDLNIELGVPATTTRTINDTAVRTLAGAPFATPGTTISLNDLRGKSSFSATSSGTIATPASGLAPGNGYIYHTFTGPGTFTVNGSKTMEILMVAGGGGTGPFSDSRCGGGGAGGLIYWSTMPVSPGTYPITVGGGGAASNGPGGNGSNSIFGPGTPLHLVSIGGGGSGGGPRGSMVPGAPGGSGGGGSGFDAWNAGGLGIQTTDPTIPANSRTYGFGFNGGSPPSPLPTSARGGGGAGEAGNTDGNGYGGDGRQYPQFVGPLIGVPALNPLSGFYAGGGGGNALYNTSSDGGGGTGGVGDATGSAGVQYTGGGGGGGGSGGSGSGTTGGPGIVIIRYLV